MLVLNDITFEFGSQTLYKNASWHIKPGEKIGLIGANGTGKSTLLRIIDGQFSLTGGEITGRRNITINFLNQDLLSYETDDSILHVAMEAFAEENRIHDAIERLTDELHHDHSDDNLNRLHDLQTRYEALDGYAIQHKAEAILEGLGFLTSDLNRPLKTFSGGWRMRVMLAKILLKLPDLLLLDEPTNHLDLPSIEWLEEYLQDYEGTVVIVSHDRYFLDRVVKKIVEVENCNLVSYPGNYSNYLVEKTQRNQLQRSKFINQQKYLKSQEKLIDRFRYKASKAKMAQARIKMLERITREEDVEEATAGIKIKFNFLKPSGKMVSDLEVKSKRYGDLEIFSDTRVQVERGDKIALIGRNGKGKSTLLRMINGNEPFSGKEHNVHQVIRTFYAQHQLEDLNLKFTLLEELQHCDPEKTDAELRALLGAFLFTGDDVFKKIRILSGGEKARVALAKAILTKANFLLLDEPTNHLDMKSVNILIDVLKKYEGSFVVVSHDRYFVSEIANKIWYIENLQVKSYPGTYDEYEDWSKRKAAPPAPAPRTAATQSNAAKNKKDPGKAADKARQALDSQVKKAGEKLDLLNKKREEMVAMLQQVVSMDSDGARNLHKEFGLLEKELEKANAQWEALYLQLMNHHE